MGPGPTPQLSHLRCTLCVHNKMIFRLVTFQGTSVATPAGTAHVLGCHSMRGQI